MKLGMDFYLYESKLVNSLVSSGRTVWSEYMFSYVFCLLKETAKLNPFYVFLMALSNVSPLIRLKPTKKGLGLGRFSILLMRNEDKSAMCTIKWLFGSLRKSSNTKSLKAREMADIILDAFEDRGAWVEEKLLCYSASMDNMPFVGKS